MSASPLLGNGAFATCRVVDEALRAPRSATGVTVIPSKGILLLTGMPARAFGEIARHLLDTDYRFELIERYIARSFRDQPPGTLDQSKLALSVLRSKPGAQLVHWMLQGAQPSEIHASVLPWSDVGDVERDLIRQLRRAASQSPMLRLNARQRPRRAGYFALRHVLGPGTSAVRTYGVIAKDWRVCTQKWVRTMTEPSPADPIRDAWEEWTSLPEAERRHEGLEAKAVGQEARRWWQRAQPRSRAR